jgi:hypothetical protein
MTRTFLLGGVIFFMVVGWLFAQQTQSVKTVAGYYVVAVCGTITPVYRAGTYGAPTMDINGEICTSQ